MAVRGRTCASASKNGSKDYLRGALVQCPFFVQYSKGNTSALLACELKWASESGRPNIFPMYDQSAVWFSIARILPSFAKKFHYSHSANYFNLCQLYDFLMHLQYKAMYDTFRRKTPELLPESKFPTFAQNHY